ncbi:MAG: dipeptide epimerase [Acidobacteria bacterium]|nr:dipeptide epimerase [Acidobacteriota bacterium]
MVFSLRIEKVFLKHRFTIARGSSDFRFNVFAKLEKEGYVGFGLAAPNPRYGETHESAYAWLQSHLPSLTQVDFQAYLNWSDAIQKTTPGEYAAKACLEMAGLDWLGKKYQLPLYQLLGIDPAQMKPTSMTIGIDEVETVKAKVREAHAYQVLKIKLGGQNDRAMIQAIRSVSDQILRVDANEGWKDKETALREIEWLAHQNVELIEQPLHSSQDEEMPWLKERSPLPLIADESFANARDIPRLHAGFHGVNLKLMKCGGILAGLQAIHMAKALDLQIMLGCMVESGLGIAAAAHLAPLVDYVDLDGNLLLAEDPWTAHPVVDGCIQLRKQPGLGVGPAQSSFMA